MTKPVGQTLPGSNADSTSAVRGIVDSAAEPYLRSKNNIGLAVGVISEAEPYSFFYGSVGGDGGAAPDENTIFEIGSITKVFTTTVLADMHLRKEVDLDDPVNKYLPVSARLPSRDAVEVTLRHLATHTSGLPRLPGNLQGKQFELANPYAHYTVDDLYASLPRTRLKCKPGTKSEYSNLGLGLLGHVLAKVSSTDYETLVKDRICRPLGMNDTTINLTEDHQQRLAVGHSGGQPVPNWDQSTLAGAGSLRSSLRDMLCFLSANISPTTTPLAAVLELAQQIQIERKYRIYRDFGCVAPLLVGGLAGLFTWQSFGLPVWARVATVLVVPAVLFYFWPTGLSTITLGWHIDDMLCDKPVLWHNGATGGYASYMAFQGETRQGVVLLSNSDGEPDPIGRRLLRGLESRASPTQAGPIPGE